MNTNSVAFQMECHAVYNMVLRFVVGVAVVGGLLVCAVFGA